MLDRKASLSKKFLNWVVTLGSLFACILGMYTRFPGMTLMGIAPNWLLIWLVAWSVNRPVFLSVMVGIALGMVQDGMTFADVRVAPTHVLGLAIAGGITSLLQKQRYVQEDFISIALIVFGMAVVVETMHAVQLTIMGAKMDNVWILQQRIALSSAILSSLWSPVIYFPLSRWWRSMDRQED
ncbi:MAG: rod shape-determining protein MreD [Pseudanabaena sp. M090S1SP1A06QC]|jgi:rod shape-determining protein MreD|uniref:rod shape-determining protein MreD n=1 Tax=Pseudanabaena mucicola TaxID=71190 RepID=UPI002577B02A|nr:rod shape-determining protein MreD [Pseudanabaena mucicola]MCA6587974.1 rod shape-determining protein MreD [Pseudanabaena sp. M109S1SP1A06QC]MCA6598043.1 rod shape-determining protein MreD [Pseudanabaena sp. M046S1SP1A06QC]MCA6603214.1 rod shape-determining protein MreD [Pseudanabaena sp. M007S1SP1A06QC]MCA6614612.1 rod shape-determining protein MreD [Pseudanabaena sp. M090S1SP1A06QC]MCA6623815.1 rod shape-determining protein MreD [Pseudanabaena sp. M165S2SP1A06QC]MCE2978030.1 rod shape-de